MGVRCIVMHDDNILFIKNTYNNRGWDLPGGGVHPGEDLYAAAKREVVEEVGLQLQSVSFLGNYESRFEYKKDQVNCFLGYADTKDYTIDPGEILEAQWFPKDNLPEVFVLAQRCLDLRK